MRTNQNIVGSYMNEREAERVIRDLLDKGYSKNDITIYTNKDKVNKLHTPTDVDVTQPTISEKNEGPEKNHEDKSFWENLKDAFKTRDEEYYAEPNYVSEDDVLFEYRDDIKKGNLVVVTENKTDSNTTEGETTVQPTDPHFETLGTTAGFPNEGSVQGMGDGGQPPVEPNSPDGTPPELEDTEAQTDLDKTTDERLRQNRRKR